jgi:quercetin dioxygenase-like cupin family protein
MNDVQKIGITGVAIAAAFVAGLQIGLAQPAAPTETKGINVKLLEAVDLGPQFAAMAGRQLRLRIITVEPGGVLGVHEHKDRPAVDYVVQGEVVDHRGSAAKAYGPGTSIAEDKDTVHWVDNKGTAQAILISADIFKP